MSQKLNTRKVVETRPAHRDGRARPGWWTVTLDCGHQCDVLTGDEGYAGFVITEMRCKWCREQPEVAMNGCVVDENG